MGPPQIHLRHRLPLPSTPDLSAPQHALLPPTALRRVPAHRLLPHPARPKRLVDRRLTTRRRRLTELGSDRGMGTKGRVCVPEGVCGVFLRGGVCEVVGGEGEGDGEEAWGEGTGYVLCGE